LLVSPRVRFVRKQEFLGLFFTAGFDAIKRKAESLLKKEPESLLAEFPKKMF
jgi:hypothetical protein